MATSECENLCLLIQDLIRMKQEFLEVYDKLFNDAYTSLKRALQLKLKAMKFCENKEDEFEKMTNRSYRSECMVEQIANGGQQNLVDMFED